jgi:hypothetical protein
MFPFSADPATAMTLATVRRDDEIRRAAARATARRAREERHAARRAAARAGLT